MTPPSVIDTLQREVLEWVARGRPLRDVLGHLCTRVESLASDVICSVVEIDAAGCLHTLASPSLPQDYSQQIEGLPIGPQGRDLRHRGLAPGARRDPGHRHRSALGPLP